MAFSLKNHPLPVSAILHDVVKTLTTENTLIVGAPPGAGKSTLLPLALLEERWLEGKKIILLEPRRIAAKSIAYRMAEMLNEDVGQTIGYRIRFETKISAQTRLEVVTEGILTRMLHSDNALEAIGLVIFDEFHERNLHADLALALCRDTQQILRPDLRVLIMSATLNMPELKRILKAPVIESEGRLFPVEIRYTGDTDTLLLPELTARLTYEAVNKDEGDVLVFLPGEAEIKKCADILDNQLNDFCIHPLYGQLSPKEQFAAILPNKYGKRKIVLATSIAETSLTIEGIKIVIDSGLVRKSVFDVKSGLSKLETQRITIDAAEQRAGRAGRLSDGICYRMWTSATHFKLTQHRIPEIEQTDLSSLLLELSKWGVSDINSLAWLSPPPKNAITYASETLHEIGALSNYKITVHGQKIHALSCHPRIANMLLMAERLEEKQLACDIAAILEERDPLPRESGIDLNLRIEALRRYRNNKQTGGKFHRIEKNAAYYHKLLSINENNEAFDPFETGLLLSYAYPERIASSRPGNNAQFQLANGKIAFAGHQDDLAHEPWICIANMDLREGLGKIFLASPLNPKDLLPRVKEIQSVYWDTRKGGIIAQSELKIGNISLQQKPLLKPDKHLIKNAICEALITEGKQLLDFNEEVLQLINRMSSLRIWNKDSNLPELSIDLILHNANIWIEPYLDQINRAEDLKKIQLVEAVMSQMDWNIQQSIQELAPEKIEVPSGSKLKIEYFNNGAQPILAVRFQEVFGWSETPKLNNGKIKLVLSLLSPGYKPVQITSDLKNFWDSTYKEVKKELQRRYPKHAWPDDPWSAKAIAKGRSYK